MAVALQGQEGGARELNGFVEERRRAEGVFIAKEWRWSGRGVGGDRRAARRALMAFGRSLVS